MAVLALAARYYFLYTRIKLMQTLKTILVYAAILALGLTIGIGGQYGYRWFTQPPPVIETDTSAHFAQTGTPVVLYTTAWCPYCKQAKAFLDERNIPYTDYDIEASDSIVIERYESIGYAGVPKIVVGNNIINGFNPELLNETLKALKLL